MATNNFLIDSAQSAGTIAQNIFNGVTRDNSLLNKFGLFTGEPPLQEGLKAKKDGLFTRFKDKIVNDATDRYTNRDYIKSLTDSFKKTGVYAGEYEDNIYGQGLESSARHIAAASNTSDYVADLISKIPGLNKRNYPSFIGDVASFGAGTIGEVKGSLFDFGKSVADGNMDTNYLSAFGQDMKDNFVGSFLTERNADSEELIDKTFERPLSIERAMIKNDEFKPTSGPVGTSATALAQIQANISAAKTKERLSNKSTKKTTATSGMMSSGGPPRRGSRRGRKKPVRRYGL